MKTPNELINQALCLPIDHGLLAWLRKAVNSGFMCLKFKNVKII
jgi:hypothetical protein